MTFIPTLFSCQVFNCNAYHSLVMSDLCGPLMRGTSDRMVLVKLQCFTTLKLSGWSLNDNDQQKIGLLNIKIKSVRMILSKI